MARGAATSSRPRRSAGSKPTRTRCSVRSIRPAHCAPRRNRVPRPIASERHREESMARRSVATALSAVLLTWAPARALAQNGWQDKPAVKTLYEKAKAEGEVVIWGPVQAEVDWIQAEFSKR